MTHRRRVHASRSTRAGCTCVEEMIIVCSMSRRVDSDQGHHPHIHVTCPSSSSVCVFVCLFVYNVTYPPSPFCAIHGESSEGGRAKKRDRGERGGGGRVPSNVSRSGARHSEGGGGGSESGRRGPFKISSQSWSSSPSLASRFTSRFKSPSRQTSHRGSSFRLCLQRPHLGIGTANPTGHPPKGLDSKSAKSTNDRAPPLPFSFSIALRTHQALTHVPFSCRPSA